ncbi:glycosyltransferase family 2 protein [Shewanella mangrovi]|uniref:glycosyltransferase family 2 protein n=1 Tax=Shewanella mangrovi TaxID=1515746 RepID=UPI00068E82AE|nr:glycosyltransferase family 2 protein [Shewanella mangrovi]
MKVSIITATYNSEKTLKSCLESVAQQSAIESIEHIVIDGRSSDSTITIVNQYKHVSKVVSAKDRGIYHAFNRGIELASGDLLYFLNADDEFYDTDVIEQVLKEMTPEYNFYCGTIYCVNQLTSESFFSVSKLDKSQNFDPPHQAFFCRKTLFDQLGPFNECLTIAADAYFMKKVIKHAKGLFTSRPIARFSLQGTSSDFKNRAKMTSQYAIIDTLLESSTENSQLSEKLALQSKNVILFKQLMLNIIRDQVPLEPLKGKRIAIFGARELSQWFYHYLALKNISVMCLVVSSTKNLPFFDEFQVIGLPHLHEKRPEVIINCIEGSHETEIGSLINTYCPEATLISWRAFCSVNNKSSF